MQMVSQASLRSYLFINQVKMTRSNSHPLASNGCPFTYVESLMQSIKDYQENQAGITDATSFPELSHQSV
jgi:hypothetical protein